MTDLTEEFFERLGRYGYEPRLVRFAGTIQFDLDRDSHVEHWLLRINQGTIQVTRETCSADLIIKADRAAFNRILSDGGGGRDIIAAYVRQAIMVKGNPRMLFVLRIIRGSAAGRHPKSMVGTPRSVDGA